MSGDLPFGDAVPYSITRIKKGRALAEDIEVAAEVPVTFMVNDREIATMMCSPSHLKEYTYGFLFTSGLIKSPGDIIEYACDETKWRIDVTTQNDIDPSFLDKRVYTSGCGKGVMYTNMVELSARHPVTSNIKVGFQDIIDCMHWLGKCSELHTKTGGVHSASASIKGQRPDFFIDDIGRHNAVDKVIGRLLIDHTDCAKVLLLLTGRISSEVLHKARRSNIPLVISRGAPTHQTILLAKEMGITVVGFVRRTNFAVYTHPERIKEEPLY
ncbi:MAG: formate dehydrogenase accessory sulfurtransferase FdhD [Desulfobacteraceae bacterium]|nr:formate dehydrogenase accessory sulfurtransferase FdhD [Desulfobacteraceae bacterium]